MTTPAANWQDLSIIIPVLNEGEAIKPLLEEIVSMYPGATVILVDDGSTDNSFEQASQVSGVQFLRHRKNIGYGASLKGGVRHAKTRVVCWFDGDNQHCPKDIGKVSRPVLSGEVVASFGVRKGRIGQSLRRMPGKFILHQIVNAISRQRIPDINCGLRAFDRATLCQYLHLLPNEFSASITTTLIFIKRGYNIAWVKIRLHPRIGHSSVSIIRDGIKSLKIIFRLIVLFSAFRFFAILSTLFLGFGILWGIYIQWLVGMGISAASVGSIIIGTVIFLLGILIDQVTEIRKERFEVHSTYHPNDTP